MRCLSFLKRGSLPPLSILRIDSLARIWARGLVVLVLTVASLVSVSAEDFTSADVYQSGVTSDSSCLNLNTKGICIHFYISCGWTGCRVKTKTVALITHNLPDLVVTAFREPGDTPYFEVKETLSLPAKEALSVLMGESSSGGYSPMTTSKAMTFNEVNVIGSPVAGDVKNILKRTGSVYGLLCDSNVSPLKPYFMSEYDGIAWRNAELNIRAESLTPGRREIGTNLLKTWGSVHPRVGFVMQNQPPKAAAVAAQRAIDIVSKNNQRPHVYSPYPIDGNPEDRASWQMIAPEPSRSCEKFGAEGEWSEGKQSINDDGDFAWTYWKEYECCGPKPRRTFYTQKIRL